ncbi:MULTISPECIES: hypothetical protein [Bacillus cereus group]|nr:MULTISPECIES: hypothetical protein [Bacillus cereus group]KZD35733.1 hypothetical protein B4083_3200 [Bacillus cereus]
MKEQIHKAWNEGFDLHEAIIASKGSVFEEKITFTKCWTLWKLVTV